VGNKKKVSILVSHKTSIFSWLLGLENPTPGDLKKKPIAYL